MPKKGNTVHNISGNMKLIDELVSAVNQDKELTKMYDEERDGNCYEDVSHRTLAFDVAVYIANYLNEKKETPVYWIGEDYNPGISKEKWQQLLQDESVFNQQALEETDFSSVELYAGSTEDDKNYWWLNANPKIWSFSEIAVGEEQNYTLYNDNGNKRRIFQNFLDAQAGDLVIGYESNPVKQIVALAKITQANDGENLYFEKVEGLGVPIDYLTLKEAPELEKMEFRR